MRAASAGAKLFAFSRPVDKVDFWLMAGIVPLFK